MCRLKLSLKQILVLTGVHIYNMANVHIVIDSLRAVDLVLSEYYIKSYLM